MVSAGPAGRDATWGPAVEYRGHPDGATGRHSDTASQHPTRGADGTLAGRRARDRGGSGKTTDGGSSPVGGAANSRRDDARPGPLAGRLAAAFKIGTLSRCRERRNLWQDGPRRHAGGGRPHQRGRNQWPIELVIADLSPPDVGRRRISVEDKVDAHQGGFLSNVPGLHAGVDEHKVVNMIEGASPRSRYKRKPHLPAVRLRRRRRSRSRRTWSASWGSGGTSRTPTTRGGKRPATPTPSRSRRPAARSSRPRASRSERRT